MTIDDKIRDENSNMILVEKQHEKKKEKSALLSGIRYEHLTCEEILPSDETRIMEQAKFTHSRLENFFVKQIKTIET